MNELIQIKKINKEEIPVVDSRDIAKQLGKKHKNLLSDIDRYIKHISLGYDVSPVDYFISNTYKDKMGQTRRCFWVTEEGFEFIANKMTGEKGDIFTALYIKKFHVMEDFIRERHSGEWSYLRNIGKQERRALTDILKDLGVYAINQGAKSKEVISFYWRYTKLENKILGVTKSDNTRDLQHMEMLFKIKQAENLMKKIIDDGMAKNIDYKKIYNGVELKLKEFSNLVS